jgi:hypothetical protein
MRFERLRSSPARLGRLVGNSEEARRIAVPLWLHLEGRRNLILRCVGADKLMAFILAWL